MDYIQWNNVLGNYFFKEENNGRQVFLYIKKIEIINFIRQYHLNYFEITNEQLVEDVIWSDFISSIKCGLPGSHGNIIDKTIYALSKKNCMRINGIDLQFPPYLMYLLIYIIPLTEGQDDLRANAYYKRLNKFLHENNLSDSTFFISSNYFEQIDPCWQELSNWANQKKEGRLGLYYVKNFSNFKYVGKPFAECLLTSKQRKRIPKLFYEANLKADDTIPDSYLERILLELGKDVLEYGEEKWHTIIREPSLMDLLVKAIREEFNNWNPNIDSYYLNIDSDRFGNRKLVVCADFQLRPPQIGLKYFRLHIRENFPEEILLDIKGEAVTITEEEHGYSQPLPTALFPVNINRTIKKELPSLGLVFTWKELRFYIFRKNLGRINEWIQVNKIDAYSKTILLLFQDQFETDLFTNWDLTGSTHKIFINIDGLPKGWKLLYCENIKKALHPRLPELQLNPELQPNIKFDKMFYFNFSFYKDCKPFVWIENSVDHNYELTAKYDDGSSIPLCYVENSEKYEFTQEHVNKIGKFKLKVADAQIESSHSYKFKDFEKLPNSQIREKLKYKDILGRDTEPSESNNTILGNELFLNRNTINRLSPLYNNMILNTFCDATGLEGLEGKYLTNHRGNLILHYLSEKGSLQSNELKDIVKYFVTDNTFDYRFKDLRFRLQELGYVDYETRSGIITITTPQAFLMSSKAGTKLILTGARDSQLVDKIISKCSPLANVSIHTLENNLLPQKIVTHFNTRDFSQIRDILNSIDILFYENGLTFQTVLCELIDDINIDHFGKGNDIIAHSNYQRSKFDLESLRFLPAVEQDIDKSLGFYKNEGIEGYKTYYTLWYNEKAFEIPDQQIGIYVLIWLHNKTRISEDINLSWFQQMERQPENFINVIKYDTKEGILAVPTSCSLPKYMTMALTLLTGDPPIIATIDGNKQLIFKNVPSTFAHNLIATKLKQVLIQKEIIL